MMAPHVGMTEVVIFLLLLMVNTAFGVVISNLLVSTPTSVIPTWGAIIVALTAVIRYPVDAQA